MRGKGAEGEGKEVAKGSLKNEKNSMGGEMLSPDNPKMREKRKKHSIVRLGNCVKLVSEKNEKKILF